MFWKNGTDKATKSSTKLIKKEPTKKRLSLNEFFQIGEVSDLNEKAINSESIEIATNITLRSSSKGIWIMRK